MSEKKSNAPVVLIVAIVAVVLLVVPCLVGVFALGGELLWKGRTPVYMQPPPEMVREVDTGPAAKGEPEPPAKPD